MEDNYMDEITSNLEQLDVKETIADSSARELDYKLNTHEQIANNPINDISNTNNIRIRLAHLIPKNYSYYPCRDYFIDDDFLHETLELPVEIIDGVAHSPANLIDYLKSIGSTPDSELAMDNASIFREMCDTYAQILDYYSGCEYYSHLPDPGFWPDDFINRVWNFCVVIHQNYNLDPQSPINSSSKLEQELAHGISLIIQQLSLIKSHYAALLINSGCQHQISLDDLTPEHADRFILLTNNLCVLMIFIKLYYSDDINPDDEGLVSCKE